MVDRNVIVVICGGDGSFMSIIYEFKKYNIDVDKIVFWAFPFGTANDIWRNFNWGTKPSEKMLNDLPLVCNELTLHAKDKYFDVWEVTVQLRDDDGYIENAEGSKLDEFDTEHFK